MLLLTVCPLVIPAGLGTHLGTGNRTRLPGTSQALWSPVPDASSTRLIRGETPSPSWAGGLAGSGGFAGVPVSRRAARPPQPRVCGSPWRPRRRSPSLTACPLAPHSPEQLQDRQQQLHRDDLRANT